MGGANADGTPGFARHRPGWGVPIHHLLVEHRVSAVFHGHDHHFVRQELDGIQNQEVPQPSITGCNSGMAADYGYLETAIFCSSGHRRVTVTHGGFRVEYVRAFKPSDETADRKNGAAVFSNILPPG